MEPCERHEVLCCADCLGLPDGYQAPKPTGTDKVVPSASAGIITPPSHLPPARFGGHYRPTTTLDDLNGRAGWHSRTAARRKDSHSDLNRTVQELAQELGVSL